jgi:hypothetical protein
MAHLRFVNSNVDKWLYILHNKGQVVLLVLVYVDNIAVASKQLKHIEEFKQWLQEFFPIKDLGELHHILGIQVAHDQGTHTIMLNQTGYIRNILTRFGMSECKPASTPLAVGAWLMY